MRKHRLNEALKYRVIKTVATFLNSNGGAQPSFSPVFVDEKGGKPAQLYIRTGNASRALDTRKIIETPVACRLSPAARARPYLATMGAMICASISGSDSFRTRCG
jgi:hypothetical protein